MNNKKQTLNELKQEAFRRQENLATDIHELLDRVHPVNAAKRFRNETADALKDNKTPLIGAVVGTVSVVAGILLLLSRSKKG